MKQKKPVYLLAGGLWRNPQALVPMLAKIIRTTRKIKPKVAYVGAASGDDKMFFTLLSALFKRAGVGQTIPVWLADNHADVALAKSSLQLADAVFVSGGDVEEGMRWITRHRLAPFLRSLHRKGVLFFGLSAGSIILGTKWVRWEDPKNDATARLFNCLAIAPVLCDMHGEKENWEELKVAVSLLPGQGKGYGVPTGGAIRVTSRGNLAALQVPVKCFQRRAGRVIQGRDLLVKE